ncbi:hypothetical protein GA0111570_10925 [Raineyella antarctica]|uniref:Uncharacterized protein n=1 Tax=Raineyella antarctica TaxID=1577474 RepID=A0A1G6HG86_9ACTN|nr:hypothetical protein GA0111570_10925 [Raineyella antarctica]
MPFTSSPFINSLVPLDIHVLHWGFITITVPNTIVIATMIIVFILALVIPFPTSHESGKRK